MKHEEYEELESYSQQEFLENRWDYKPGDHVTFIAPTQNGKTTFIFKLLENTKELENPTIMLVMKPRDKVVSEGIKKLGYKRIKHYPPTKSIADYVYKEKPKGYALWPDHTFDPSIDEDNHYDEMRKGILGPYKKGNSIIIADET